MFPWILCGVLALLSIYLILRLVLLRKSLDELREYFTQNIKEESNGLIRISSRDPKALRCAAEINAALRELRGQRHRYMSGDRELKNAVSNVSHDLRTPLTAICGYLALLEQEEVSPDASRYIAIIRDRAEAMRSLCEELFHYSLASSEERQMNPEKLSLNAVLQESLAASYTLLKERGICPMVSMPEKDIYRTLDHAAIMRVLSNLLSNAAKYSDGDLTISLSERGELCFANTASALSEIEVGRLFDRFYTVDSARKSTGLGLAISRALVERMGGSIEAFYPDTRLEIKICFPQEDYEI